jgi:hypothetical protein
MSRAELERLVNDASTEEQEFLFVYLSERLRPNTNHQLEELDKRLDDLNAGKKRLSLEAFEKRLDSK